MKRGRTYRLSVSRWRRETAAICVLVAALVGCSPDESPTSSVVPTVDLLASAPRLPRTWTSTRAGLAPHPEEITWHQTASAHALDATEACDGGRALIRTWQDTRTEFVPPRASQMVCGYESVAAATDALTSVPMVAVLGQNYPNTDDGVADVPTAWDASTVDGSEPQIACASGDADGTCGVWLYRARYGTFVVAAMFFSDGGGIRAAQFLELVKSVDAVAASSPSGTD